MTARHRGRLERCLKYHGARPCDEVVWRRIQRRYDDRRIFVNIPFVPAYIRFGARLVTTLTSLNLIPVTARDERRSAEFRICKICELMQTCKYCISDLTHWRPNVALEIGIAVSLGCHTMVLASDRHDVIREMSDYNAFDAIDHRRDWRVMVRKVAEWVKSDVVELRTAELAINDLCRTVDRAIRSMLPLDIVPTHEQARDALASISTHSTNRQGTRPCEVYIPAGVFPAATAGEWKATAAFLIDAFPVTNADYARFLRHTEKGSPRRTPHHWKGDRPPRSIARHPVVCVSFEDAAAFAAWAGKRLPTADEWEKAACGPDGWEYPWGDDFDGTVCNTGRQRNGTRPVDSYPSGRSFYGVWDLAGNVWEWTTTRLGEGKRVIKGSSWINNPEAAANYYRTISSERKQEDNIGFRCVRDAPTVIATAKRKSRRPKSP